MRNLPSRFNSKVSIAEYISNLDTKDEIYGILIAYEMRKKPQNVSRKKATFKSTRKQKFNKNEFKNISDMSYEEETNFVSKLNIGQGKYKENLRFKWFKCGRIGHFASKCTYEENKEIEREEDSDYQE